MPLAVRRLIRLCMAGICLFLAAASASAAEVEVEIPILPASYGSAFFVETGLLLAKQKPGVTYHVWGDTRIADKLRVRAMAGAWPDATDAQLDYDTLIGAGKIRDLTAYLEGPNWDGTGKWKDDFLPGMLERWQRNGKTYAIPYAYAPWLIFYNKRLFAEHGWAPPRTWDEWFALGAAMRSAGVEPLSVPGVYLRYADAFLRAGVYNLGGAAAFHRFQTLAPGAFVEPAFLTAADFTQRTAQAMFMTGWEGMTHTSAQQALLDGHVAMNLSGAWFLSEMRSRIPPDFDLGIMNLPRPEGATSAPAVQAQAAYYFLFSTGDAAREQATVDYFRFLTSRSRARDFVQRIQSPVALRNVSTSEYVDPRLQRVAEVVEQAPALFDAAPPQNPAFQSWIAQGLNEGRFELMTGRVTPGQFGKHLEEVAEGERRRIQNPDAVVNRHGLSALLLGAAVLALGYLGFRSRGGVKPAGTGLPALRGGFGLGFIGPALIVFGAFVLVPGAASFFWAFRHDNGFGASSWAGWFNFRWLLEESDLFWLALKNNLFLMAVPTVAVVPTALVFASLIHRGTWGAGFFRAVFLFPNLLGGIAAALLWMNAFDPHAGLVNAVLVQLGQWLGSDWLKSFSGYAWLSADRLYWALVPIYLWMACGFNLVLYLAAMQAIDPELYEAAAIDGASGLRQFFLITIPLIWDVIIVSAVFIVIAGLNTFEMVWLLTSQDPTSRTHVLSTLMVTTLFREFQVGRATAIAVIMFVLVFTGSFAVQRVLRRKGEA